MKILLNWPLNSIILTPKGSNNPGIVRSLSWIGWSAAMVNVRGLTPDANVGGEADTGREVSIDTDNIGNNTTDWNNINDSTINIWTGNRNGQASRSNPTVYTSKKVFKGTELDIGYFLGLRFEKVDNKVAYGVFRNKFTNYIFRNMQYGNRVVCAVKEYKDTMTDYEENKLP